VNAEKILDDIREANLSYLLLAQHLIRTDREQALYRLGLSEEIADIIDSLGTGQILKIAGASLLLCRLRFDDQLIWSLLGGQSTRKEVDIGGIHASILMSGTAALSAA